MRYMSLKVTNTNWKCESVKITLEHIKKKKKTLIKNFKIRLPDTQIGSRTTFMLNVVALTREAVGPADDNSHETFSGEQSCEENHRCNMWHFKSSTIPWERAEHLHTIFANITCSRAMKHSDITTNHVPRRKATILY